MKKIYIEDIDDEKKLGEAIAGSDLLINATRAGMESFGKRASRSGRITS